jgi:septal ring factor EnvC (AmiA/AmiB activator)
MTTKEHLAKHDREIAAIRKLLLTGMKMLTHTNERLDRLTDQVERLPAAQRETDKQVRETNRQLQALIGSLRRGNNGHGKRV